MNSELRILIVEDDKLQAYLLQKLLENLGYSVAGVTSTGEEAVELVPKLEPQLILMDIALAGEIDGIEAVRRIRESNSSVNVIYITGNSDPSHKERAKQMGFVDFLIKPINKSILVDSISKTLN